jgi:PKD repeat protein
MRRTGRSRLSLVRGVDVGVTTRSLVCAVLLGMMAACTVHQSDQAPPLSGPSTFAQSLSVTATPDLIAQDGRSQSAINVRVFGVNGQPIGAVPVRVDILVGGTLVDYGTLSTKSIVTGTDGRATTVYTAPPPPPPTAQTSSTVTIRAATIGTDAPGSAPFSTDIRLVPPGVILPPAGTPTARFITSPPSPVAPAVIKFDASTSDPGSNAGAITSFGWVFGDGTSASGPENTITHRYATAATYEVTLTVTNDRGLSASTSQGLVVTAPALLVPSIVFSPTAPISNEQVLFDGRGSTTAEGTTITGYTWSFLDDDTQGTGAVVAHTFVREGTWVVRLTVADSQGRTATTTVEVVVKLKGTP